MTKGTKALSRARAKAERGAWKSLNFSEPLCQSWMFGPFNIFAPPVTEKKTETVEETEYNDKIVWQIDGQREKIERE